MFSFFNMIDDYETRKVARYEVGDLMISTCRVTDSSFPYETAVAHPNYNNGKIVIVDNYDTLNDAKKGHERWVKIMTLLNLCLKDYEMSAKLKLHFCLTFLMMSGEIDQNYKGRKIMSHDNWTICPRCSEKAIKNKEKAIKKAEESYGKVSPKDYLELLNVANNPMKPDYTLAEDYEVGIREGEFVAVYSSRCKVCGFTYEYRHREPING